MRRRRCGRREKHGQAGGFALAFGVALFLSLILSPRFALFLAAIVLIYIGITCRP